MGFGLPQKIGKTRPKMGKMARSKIGFRGHFPIFRQFFPVFVQIFAISGRRPETYSDGGLNPEEKRTNEITHETLFLPGQFPNSSIVF